MPDLPAENRILTVKEFEEAMRPYDIAFNAAVALKIAAPEVELSPENIRSFVDAARESLGHA